MLSGNHDEDVDGHAEQVLHGKQRAGDDIDQEQAPHRAAPAR
jgi:hypothetical protein